jgi:hypothetical protein
MGLVSGKQQCHSANCALSVRIMRHLTACDLFTLVEDAKYRPTQLALLLADGSPVGDCVKHLCEALFKNN